jgi:outer membrane protein TolC
MKSVILTTALAILAISCFAQETGFGGLQNIDLPRAKELALAQNPDYQAGGESLDAATWSRKAALSSFMPSLSFGATYLWMDPATTYQAGSQTVTLNKDIRSLAFNLSQPLFLGGKLWQAYKTAAAAEDIARLGYEGKRYDIISATEDKYYGVLQLRAVYKLAGTELRSARENMQLAELKLENGLLSRADYLRFQAALANKEVAELQAQTALQLALQDFANHLGLGEPLMPEDIPLDTGSEVITALQGMGLDGTERLAEKAENLLEGRNLNLKILDRSEELSERAYKMARAAFLPSLILTGSRQFEENGIDRYTFEPSTQILLNFSLPLLPSWGSYANLRKAKAEVRKTRLTNKSAENGIRLGTKAAVIGWVSSAQQLKSARIALDYSEELYAQLQERFRQNMLSALDLLDAELMLSAARLSYNNAYYSYLRNRSSLMKALALDSPSELDQLITLQGE